MTEQPARQRRRKVTLACEPCRERKARCDGRKPLCSTCQRRSFGLEQCIYKAGNARTACSDDYTKALHARIRHLEQVCALHGIDPDGDPTFTAVGPQINDNSDNDRDQRDVASASIEVHETQSLTAPSSTPTESMEASRVTAMGTSTSEEHLRASRELSHDYFGTSSTASFLKEACGTINPPLSDVLNPKSTDPQPASLQPPSFFSGLEKFVLPPRSLADHLKDRYFKQFYYLNPFFDKSAFEHAYQSLWQSSGQTRSQPDSPDLGLGSSPGGDSTSIAFHSALNAIFALGTIFSDLPAPAKMTAFETFLDRSKQHLGIDLLDLNNLTVVQNLLLLAQALQATQYPNRCWNAVGVACRMAQGLGLHIMGTNETDESSATRIRRRVWCGCVVMDTLVSMTFGRPTMITNLSTVIVPKGMTYSPSSAAANPEVVEDMKLHYHSESVRLSIILDSILSKIYQPWRNKAASDEAVQVLSTDYHSMDTFAEHHAQLNSFERTVPDFLSWKTPSKLDWMSPEDAHILTIQRNVLHQRLLYLRLMLSRPILTKLLASDASSSAITTDADDNFSQSSFRRDGSKACVRAAVQLINSVHSTLRTEKGGAWWWNGLYACTASLVLITCRLCPSLSATLDHVEIAEASEKGSAILEESSSYSSSLRKAADLLQKINQAVASRLTAQDLLFHNDVDLDPDAELLDMTLGGDLSLQDALGMTFPFDPESMACANNWGVNFGGD